jgi:hypothetical protein
LYCLCFWWLSQVRLEMMVWSLNISTHILHEDLGRTGTNGRLEHSGGQLRSESV